MNRTSSRFRPAAAGVMVFIFCTCLFNADLEASEAGAAEAVAHAAAFTRTPVYFIENRGQLNDQVRFYEQGPGRTTLFADGGVHIVPHASRPDGSHVAPVGIAPIGAQEGCTVTAGERLAGKVNVFRGNDPSRWTTAIPTYRSVVYKGVYPGIDIEFYGHERGLEYDVIVHPGGDPAQVRFRCTGIDGLEIDASGDLHMRLHDGATLIQKKPRLYQEVAGGRRIEVEGGFVTGAAGKTDGEFTLSFTVGDHDAARPLVIDPVIVYSTYYGGKSTDFSRAIAVDAAGCAYITGLTESADLLLKNPFQKAYEGEEFVYLTDVFVTKLAPSGKELVYSTFLGGSVYKQGSAADFGKAVAVDSKGHAIVTGHTNSKDFPLKKALQPEFGGDSDVFITKFSPAGDELVFSTYLGGDESDYGIAIETDDEDDILIAGFTASENFPCKNAWQDEYGGGFDAILFKIDASGKSLVYSSYLGGDEEDLCQDLAVDEDGNAYVCGQTASKNFPVVDPAQAEKSGALDAFAAKVEPDGEELEFATFLGGGGDDFAQGIAVDEDGLIYVTGKTRSIDFPLENPHQPSKRANHDVFILQLDDSGDEVLYSTFFGGDGSDTGIDVAIDGEGRICVFGSSNSKDFPRKKSIQKKHAGYLDLFVLRFAESFESLDFSTLIGGGSSDHAGGMALDPQGNIYVTGWTRSEDFPTTTGTLQEEKAHTFDAFIVKVSGKAAESGDADALSEEDEKTDK